MTDQELIAMARAAQRDDRLSTGALYGDLADRIEELVKERDELGCKLHTARFGQLDFAWYIHEEAMADLRVKLTKAMEALRFYTYGHSTPPTSQRAHKVLAELEK